MPLAKKAIALAVAALFLAPLANAQNMTDATRKLLQEAKLEPSILSGLDQELAVPQAMIDGAKKEGLLRVRLTVAERLFDKVWQVFAARYPGIKYEYVRGIGPERAVVALVAFKRGTIISDVVGSFDVLLDEYEKAGALAKIDDLPAWKNPLAEFRASNFAAYRQEHWGVGWNTKKVKREELPKTWEDIVNNPRWHNGKIGMAVNANTWIPPLAGVYGQKWAEDYMEAIFAKVKPQLRKERLSMLPQLNHLGEYDLGIPAGDFIYKVQMDRGMDISVHFPEPVPNTAAPIGIISNNPHPNAARLFVNWVLSKEGQIALHVHDEEIPSHTGLPKERFQAYPKELEGKKVAPSSAAVVRSIPALMEKWHKLWVAAGGQVEGGN
jgi:iron(III) transport system substrate-binding protein